MRNTEAFVEAARNTFTYDPTTASKLRRNVRHRESTKPFRSAYRTVDVCVEGVRVVEYVHRIVWMIHHGVIPSDKVIDHIDRDKLNNTIENLRLATPSENGLNKDKRPVNDYTSRLYEHGSKLVKWHASFKHYVVSLVFPSGHIERLGSANTVDEINTLLRLGKTKRKRKVN